MALSILFIGPSVQVFISIALILGDGLYSFVKILARTGWTMYQSRKGKTAKVGKNRGLSA